MLNPEIEASASIARHALDDLLAIANRESAKLVNTSDLPTVVSYFSDLRDRIQDLARQTTALTKHVEELSHQTIPTLFENANIKTITVNDVGRVTVNVRWSASPVDKETAFGWLRQTGNEGLIIQTVNAQTLAAFAKEEALAGRPLPADVFKVGTSNFVSITAV